MQPIGAYHGLGKPVVFVLLYMFHVICHVENWADQLKMKLFRLPYTVHTYVYIYISCIYIYI